MKMQLVAACGVALFLGCTAQVFAADAKEPAHHREYPKLAKAVHALQAAIKDMEKSKKDFHGKKDESIADARKAMKSLHEAMGVSDEDHAKHHHH